MGLSVKPQELAKFLESQGFVFDRARGTSHHIYKKDGISVPVPFHKGKDVPKGTLFKILDISELSKKDLEKWLGR